MKKYWSGAITTIGFMCAVGAIVPQVAFAQDAKKETPDASQVARGVSVVNRPRPDFDALGLRVGSFLVFPKADVKETYNSNIYATQNSAISDFITVLSPSLAVHSDWNQHALNLGISVDSAVYGTHTSENYNEFNVNADGRVDVLRDAYVTGALQFKRLHEDRGDPNANAAAAEPTMYNQLTGRVGGSYGVGRLSTRLNGSVNVYSYDTTRLTGGGTQDNSGRDRAEYEVGPRVAFELVPGVTPFVETLANWRRYTAQASQYRNSSGYRVNVGTSLDLGGVITGNIYTGYMAQNYEGAQLQGISGIGFGGSLLWNPTGLTSVILNASRTVEETTNAAASGYLSSNVSLRLEHELMRSVVAYGSVAYAQNDYVGNGQKETIPQATLGGEYYINRYFSVSPEYSYKKKNSNQVSGSYTDHLVSLRLSGKL